jgi:hypothetical protein
MIPATALAYLKALEDAMPLKPRIKVKAKGIPIGSYDVIADAAGKQLVKPKVSKRGPTLNQQYKSKNRKRYRGVK